MPHKGHAACPAGLARGVLCFSHTVSSPGMPGLFAYVAHAAWLQDHPAGPLHVLLPPVEKAHKVQAGFAGERAAEIVALKGLVADARKNAQLLCVLLPFHHGGYAQTAPQIQNAAHEGEGCVQR